MTQLLVKLFISNREELSNPKVRQAYGLLSGTVGIICNILLFLVKLFAGIMTGAISITADAFNNLSDAGSSVVTFIGFKMAGKPADTDHPFGHGRIEYLAGLFVSVAVIIVGVQLIQTSFNKLIMPEVVTYSHISVIILILSVLLKFWMALFNKSLGNLIHSQAMKATATDSLSDCMATSTVLLSIVIYYVTGYNVDGLAGLIVAVFIVIAGITAVKETLQPLLGQAPDEELVKGIQKLVLEHKEIIGIHDLVVHDYGPGRIMASLHVEIPYDMDILYAHDIIDGIEFDIKRTFNCDVTIHMDPIVTDDTTTNMMRDRITEIVKSIDEGMSIHDFRMTQGPLRLNLIFDVLVPFDITITNKEIKSRIIEEVKRIDNKYYAVINIDKGYV